MHTPHYTSENKCVEVMRLHTDKEDCVWYGDDDMLGVNSYLSPDEFFNSAVLSYKLSDIKCIRLLGNKENAPLIVSLQKKRASDPVLNRKQKIQLCSPDIMNSLKNIPEQVLHSLWQPSYINILSGSWHDMENSDVCSYLMLTDIHGHTDVPEIVQHSASYHPAWPAIMYLKNFNINSACRLITEIIDPRWYRHPFKPDRNSKLYSYLGLTPANIAAYFGDGLPDRHYQRAVSSISTWYNTEPAYSNFIRRYFDKYEDLKKGVLQCTKFFISFLKAVWLANVSINQKEMHFNTAYFFKDNIEIEEFEQFRMTWKVA